MTPDARAALEAELRRLYDAGDLDAVATEALRGYGPELLGFLVGLARDHDRGADLFSAMSEKLWRGLAKFRWGSSLRVWAYALARNTFIDSTRSPRARDMHLSQVPEPVAAVARTTTAAYQRTATKDAFAEIRASLDQEDQALLGLRVEGEMAWLDIARVLGHGEDSAVRESASLRKRFERLKQRLKRELAERALPRRDE